MTKTARELTPSAPRLAGTEAERRALAEAARRIERGGDAVAFEGFVAVTSPPLTAAAHLIAAALAVAIGWWWPLVALGALGVVMRSSLAELRGDPPWIRQLIPRDVSYNLLARRPPGGGRRGTLVLAVHLDSPRRGLRLRRGMIYAFFAVLGISTLAAMGRASGLAWSVLIWTQLLSGAAFIASALAALTLHRLSPTQEEERSLDALEVAASHLADAPLEHLELVLLVAGCGAAHADGVRALIRQHRHEWCAEDTAFVFIDGIGPGALRYGIAEQVWEPVPYRPTLPAILERLARGAKWRDLSPATLDRVTGAAHVSREGFRAVTVTSDAEGEPGGASAERCGALLAELARRYDRDLGEAT